MSSKSLVDLKAQGSLRHVLKDSRHGISHASASSVSAEKVYDIDFTRRVYGREEKTLFDPRLPSHWDKNPSNVNKYLLTGKSKTQLCDFLSAFKKLAGEMDQKQNRQRTTRNSHNYTIKTKGEDATSIYGRNRVLLHYSVWWTKHSKLPLAATETLRIERIHNRKFN